jgi:hypothetical protein
LQRFRFKSFHLLMPLRDSSLRKEPLRESWFVNM